MWDLFKAEFLRFRLWAIAYALLHLAVLGFMTRVVDLAQQPLLVYRVICCAYVVSGLLFGLFQMGGYRRPNTWLNLLHRPLPHWQVALSLLGAALLLLAIAIAAPILVTALWQETKTARVVDLRHWLMPLSAFLLGACAYLAGAYAMLGQRRYSVSGLVFLVLVAATAATGAWVLLAQALALLWLAALVFIAFKPDLSAAPRRGLPLLATALPLQLGIYYLLVILGFGVELIWIMEGTHPNNSTPPRGGFVEAIKADGRDLMRSGLADSQHPQAPLWREQIALSEVHGMGRQFDTLPIRGQLTNIVPMEFDDSERRLRWVFSHDRMRFESHGLADGKAGGVLGVGADGAEFPSPPLPLGSLPGLSAGDSILLGNDAVYHYSSESQQVRPRIVLSGGETFAAAPGSVGESVTALSNQALYFFDGRDVVEHDDVLTPRLRVPLPGKIGNLSTIDLIELVDGYLISFTFAATTHNAKVDPFQQTLHVHDDGRIDAVARRELGRDYPAWHRYELWWLSPPMFALHNAATQLFADPAPLNVIDRPPVPRSIWILATLLSLLAMGVAIWRSGRQDLSLRARIVWVLACGLVGVPGVVSLWLLYPAREQSDEVPMELAAAA
jgi:hypothetical protein